LKESLMPHGKAGFVFFNFVCLARMAGRLGFQDGKGCTFMTESQFQRCRPGLDSLQDLHSLDAAAAYQSFLMLQGSKSMSRFASPGHQALARLLCLGCSLDHERCERLCINFGELPDASRLLLSRFLNYDGINQFPGHTLADAPSLLQNGSVNPAVGINRVLQMLLSVVAKCGEISAGVASCKIVVVELGNLAKWAARTGKAESEAADVNGFPLIACGKLCGDILTVELEIDTSAFAPKTPRRQPTPNSSAIPTPRRDGFEMQKPLLADPMSQRIVKDFQKSLDPNDTGTIPFPVFVVAMKNMDSWWSNERLHSALATAGIPLDSSIDYRLFISRLFDAPQKTTLA